MTTTTTTTERIVCSGTLMTNEVREVLISALVERCSSTVVRNFGPFLWGKNLRVHQTFRPSIALRSCACLSYQGFLKKENTPNVTWRNTAFCSTICYVPPSAISCEPLQRSVPTSAHQLALRTIELRLPRHERSSYPSISQCNSARNNSMENGNNCMVSHMAHCTASALCKFPSRLGQQQQRKGNAFPRPSTTNDDDDAVHGAIRIFPTTTTAVAYCVCGFSSS